MPEEDAPKFLCVVCGEESDAMICDECWEDYKVVAGTTDEDE